MKYLMVLLMLTLCSCWQGERTWDKKVKVKEVTSLCEDCNILMVSIDTVRHDHMSMYGYQRKTTPELDKLKKYSTIYKNFIVHSYLTPISQMSIFSSDYPTDNGVVSVFSELRSDRETLPEVLKRNGYKTAAFGSSMEVMTEWWEDLRKNVSLYKSFKKGFDEFYYSGFSTLPTDALDWIGENKKNKFFLWIPLDTVHYPYGFNGEIDERGMYDPKDYQGIFKDRFLSYQHALRFLYEGFYYFKKNDKAKKYDKVPIKEKDHQYIVSRYDYGIFRTDRFIGNLLNELSNSEILKKTIVIIHGVHGEDLGEHGYYGHYDIYDTEVKSPLLIFNPQNTKKAREVNQVVRGIDISPTLLELVKASRMKKARGVSLLEIDKKQKDLNLQAYIERTPLWEDFVLKLKPYIPKGYSQKIQKITKGYRYKDTALRNFRWKLIHRKSRHIEEKISYWKFLTGKAIKRTEYELYDILKDPFERRNVIKEFPVVAEKMKREILAIEKKQEGLH